jgi:hypothetical protein
MVQTNDTAPAPASGEASLPPELNWFGRTLQWDTRAEPGKAGLRIQDLNIGVYGEIPEHVETRTRMPRGAYPATGVAEIGGYHLRDAYQLWSDNAGELYEEAIQRRWSTATDLDWEAARGLPRDVELAICQVATELCHQANIEMEVISGWLQQLNPVFHEVKLHLSTNLFDAARLFDGYRKRAMLNGGGMLLESPGWVNRIILESIAGWTETTLLLHILRGSFTHTLLRYLAAYAPSSLDRELALRTMADKTRHIQYAVGHLRYSFALRPEFARTYSTALAGAEAAVLRDERDPVLWEALAIIFGGGVRGMDEGMRTVERLQRDWVRAYLGRLRDAGIEHEAELIGALRSRVEPADAAGAVAARAPRPSSGQA